MKILKYERKNLDELMQNCREVIEEGGIIAGPSDSCYGLLGDIFNEKVVRKIYQIKGRNLNKPVNIIVPDIDQFKIYGQWSSLISEFLKDNKRIISFIVKKTEFVPKHLNPSWPNLGIQIPENKFLLLLLRTINIPLIATSANVSSCGNIYSIKRLVREMEKVSVHPEIIVDAGNRPYAKTSKIIEIINSKQYKILRK